MSESTGGKKLTRFWPYTAAFLCLLIMLPRLLSPQFGLMDDGRSLSIAEGISNGRWDLSWDLQGGRSRPLYWAAFAFWYLLVKGQPFWYFFGSWIVFTMTTLILIRLVLELGGTKQQAFASGLFFAISGPVIENVYTLSKGENLQLLLLSSAILAVVFAARRLREGTLAVALAAITLLILAGCLVKETSLAMIPISLAWWASAWLGRGRHFPTAAFAEKATRLLTLASLVSGGLYYLGRSAFVSSRLAGVGYTSHFVFEAGQILDGAVRWGGWMLRDYTWLAPLGVVVIAFCLGKRHWPASGLWWFAMIWMAAWLGLYLPWYFAVEYYLLLFAAGAALLAGVLFVETINLLKEASFAWRASGATALGLSALLMLGSLANNAASAAVQLAQDAANSGMLAYVAEKAPAGSAVIVNIQVPNEYVEQMQLMLADFYDRSDLYVTNYHVQDLSQLADQYPAVYVLLPELENQPLMTVRMGLVEDSQKAWNSSLLPLLDVSRAWQIVYQVDRQARLVTVDFPRLVCPVIYRENYCGTTSRLINNRIFRYQWTVFRSQSSQNE